MITRVIQTLRRNFPPFPYYLDEEVSREQRDIINYIFILFGFAFVFLYTAALKDILENDLRMEGPLVIGGINTGIKLGSYAAGNVFLVTMCIFFAVQAYCFASLISDYTKRCIRRKREFVRYCMQNSFYCFSVVASNVLCVILPFLYLCYRSDSEIYKSKYFNHILIDSVLIVLLVVIAMYIKTKKYRIAQCRI